MFPLSRQVQICCDSAKLAASYLSGKPAESQPDTETTLDELRARVQSIVRYLDGFTAADFAGAANQVVSQPRWKGEWMTGEEYLLQHGLPNFFFHLTTAYAILRHAGVGIGKRDFLGPQDKKPPAN
jgi:hypothetical protein